MNNFDSAHRSWEASWINGPDEDCYEEELADMSDEDLVDMAATDDDDWREEMTKRGLDIDK